MILIHCRKTTSRISYAAGLLIETILGMEWQITSDMRVFSEYQGAKIQYGSKRLASDGLYVHAARLLSEQGISHFEPKHAFHEGLAVLFPSTNLQCDMGFDPFAAAFYLTSRYEEYLPFVKDRFGRFEARESYAYKKGFYKIPVVDHYALLLKNALKQAFPSQSFPSRSFRFIPTVDVDVAYAFKGRGVIRTLYGSLKSLKELDIKSLKQRYRVVVGKEKDPFDTYDLQLTIHKKYGLKAYYFFLCGEYGPYDKNISVSSLPFQKLVKKIGDYATVGIHPSFSSNTNGHRTSMEVRRLSSILNRPINHSRQHYLMLSIPQTYRKLLEHDITNDFSMGFASLPGFRAGTCTPYYFYDIDKESVTRLMVYPLGIMDGTLKDYMKLTPHEAINTIAEHMLEVKKVNGTFVSLWHNDSFSDQGHWKGWLQVYEKLLHLATS